MSLEDDLKSEARRQGFSLCGIAAAKDADHFDAFEAWLDSGHHGEMAYLVKGSDARRHPRSILPEVKSVLMVGLEYADAGDDPLLPVNHGRVARYARGPDYHRLIWDRLNHLADWLRERIPGCQTKGTTDTAPLLERDFARRAGLGWVGRNTMLIHPARGSYFFLGALLTDVALTPDPPFEPNHCGTCTACLDACPTDAFPEPGVLDARRCISYLTIELRSPVPDALRPPVGDWLFGCDVCQEVCPWNRFAGREGVPFPVDPGLTSLDCIELLGLDDAAFRERFRGTSFTRTKRRGLLRNAAIVLGNSGDRQAIPALEWATTDPDEVIREAAKWGLQRLRERLA